ncbi:MAG: hypothetical protein WC867_07520 [Candidatus Pacearchaeota archaeon]|jgi:hypothetical protein
MPKKDLVKVKKIDYLPVDRSEKPSIISIENYSISKGGFRTGYLDSTDVIAYCIASPKYLLEELFLDYTITNFNGFQLYSGSDLENLRGIGISQTNQFEGVMGIEINGTVKDLLNLESVISLRRSKSLTDEERSKIKENVTKNLDNSRYRLEYKQNKQLLEPLFKYLEVI